jgi:hypothetical protein
MAKRKTVSHLPTAPSSSASRLAAKLFTVMGEILLMIVIGVGFLTVADWALDKGRVVHSQPPVHLHSRDLP